MQIALDAFENLMKGNDLNKINIIETHERNRIVYEFRQQQREIYAHMYQQEQRITEPRLTGLFVTRKRTHIFISNIFNIFSALCAKHIYNRHSMRLVLGFEVANSMQPFNERMRYRPKSMSA